MKKLGLILLLGVFPLNAVLGMLPSPKGVRVAVSEEKHLQPIQTILAQAVQEGVVLEYRQLVKDSNRLYCAFFVDKETTEIVSKKLREYFGSEAKDYIKYLWTKEQIERLCVLK